MLPIAICDDEPMHRQRTAAVLQEKIAGYAPAFRLFASSAELLNAVETEGYAPRIAVLDIQMQEMDGISLARELNQKLPQCAVIFLTAFLSLATEVYEAKHVYFIVKSQLEARIERAVELALKQAEEDLLLLYRCGTVQRGRCQPGGPVPGAGSAPHQSQNGTVRGLGAGGPGDAAAGAAPGAVRPVSSELLGQSAPYHGHGTRGVRPLGWNPKSPSAGRSGTRRGCRCTVFGHRSCGKISRILRPDIPRRGQICHNAIPRRTVKKTSLKMSVTEQRGMCARGQDPFAFNQHVFQTFSTRCAPPALPCKEPGRWRLCGNDGVVKTPSRVRPLQSRSDPLLSPRTRVIGCSHRRPNGLGLWRRGRRAGG